MIIDGEKYACEACVRGHRVSNCQHSDRPLQHINKKGRPVSQCAHCRSSRKSRAAHIKCDCGEKTSKCAHLQSTIEGHTETCCCNHGGRCTCVHKKESSLDTVHESDSEQESTEIHHTPASVLVALSSDRPARPSIRRRRANTIHADGVLFFDENGHHKPSAKHNRAAQKCNPYQLNRVNSTNSACSLGAGVEGLTFNHSDVRTTPKSLVVRERRVKSETASPLISSTGFSLAASLPPLDLSGIDNVAYVSSGPFDLFSGTGFDQDGPMYSAGLSAASVDWSHYDLGEARAENFAPSSYSQAGGRSLVYEFGSGSEQLPNLANTTSTSGEVSEVEDLMPCAEKDLDGFGGSSFLRPNMMASGADLASIDYDNFYKNAVDRVDMSLVEDDPAFWMPNYNDGLASLEEGAEPISTSTANSFWPL